MAASPEQAVHGLNGCLLHSGMSKGKLAKLNNTVKDDVCNMCTASELIRDGNPLSKSQKAAAFIDHIAYDDIPAPLSVVPCWVRERYVINQQQFVDHILPALAVDKVYLFNDGLVLCGVCFHAVSSIGAIKDHFRSYGHASEKSARQCELRRLSRRRPINHDGSKFSTDDVQHPAADSMNTSNVSIHSDDDDFDDGIGSNVGSHGHGSTVLHEISNADVAHENSILVEPDGVLPRTLLEDGGYRASSGGLPVTSTPRRPPADHEQSNKVSELICEIGSVREQLQRTVESLRQSEQEVEKLTGDLESQYYAGDVERQNLEFGHLEETNAHVDEINRLRRELEHQQSDVGDTAEQRSAVEDEVVKLRSAVEDKDARIAALERKETHAQELTHTLRRLLAQRDERIARLTSDLDGANNEIVMSRRECSAQAQKRKASTQDGRWQNTQRHTSNTTMPGMGETQTLQAAIVDKDTIISDLRRDLNTANEARGGTLKTLLEVGCERSELKDTMALLQCEMADDAIKSKEALEKLKVVISEQSSLIASLRRETSTLPTTTGKTKDALSSRRSSILAGANAMDMSPDHNKATRVGTEVPGVVAAEGDEIAEADLPYTARVPFGTGDPDAGSPAAKSNADMIGEALLQLEEAKKRVELANLETSKHQQAAKRGETRAERSKALAMLPEARKHATEARAERNEVERQLATLRGGQRSRFATSTSKQSKRQIDIMGKVIEDVTPATKRSKQLLQDPSLCTFKNSGEESQDGRICDEMVPSSYSALPTWREPGMTDAYYRKCPVNETAISFISSRISAKDAAHCRLRVGRDELTADLAFEKEDDLLEAQHADPVRDVGKSGRAQQSICGKSQWTDTDGGIGVSVLIAVFKERIKAAAQTMERVTVTFGEQQAKHLSRILCFLDKGYMEDVPTPIADELWESQKLNFTKLTPEHETHIKRKRHTVLNSWVREARAHIKHRKATPGFRSRSTFDVGDDELYATFANLEKALEPDVLKHYFELAADVYNMGANSLFNGAKGLKGLLQLMATTVDNKQSKYGERTVLGQYAAYIEKSMAVLSSVTNRHGPQRRAKEKLSKKARETGYYLANILDARRLVFDNLYNDLTGLSAQVLERHIYNDKLQNDPVTQTIAVQLRGALVVAFQTSSPPLRVGAYMHLTQLATLRACMSYTEELLKQRKAAESSDREAPDTTIVYLPVSDKTSMEWGKAGLKIDAKMFDLLSFWVRHGRARLGPSVAATTIPSEIFDKGRLAIKLWCTRQEQDPNYNLERDMLFPSVNNNICMNLGSLTKPIYNEYIGLELNATSVRRSYINGARRFAMSCSQVATETEAGKATSARHCVVSDLCTSQGHSGAQQERAYTSDHTLMEEALKRYFLMEQDLRRAPGQVRTAAGGLMLNEKGEVSDDGAQERLLATARLAEQCEL